jgi:hypothetical protein
MHSSKEKIRQKTCGPTATQRVKSCHQPRSAAEQEREKEDEDSLQKRAKRTCKHLVASCRHGAKGIEAFSKLHVLMTNNLSSPRYAGMLFKRKVSLPQTCLSQLAIAELLLNGTGQVLKGFEGLFLKCKDDEIKCTSALQLLQKLLLHAKSSSCLVSFFFSLCMLETGKY